MDQRNFEGVITAMAAKGAPTPLASPQGLKERLAYLAELLRNDAYEGDQGRLFWRAEGGVVMSLPLAATLLIGRDAAANIIVANARVSRRHCAISAAPEGDYVEDLGSTNGTQVNGEAVVGRRRLFDGDFIEAAGFLVVYVAPRSAGAPSQVLD